MLIENVYDSVDNRFTLVPEVKQETTEHSLQSVPILLSPVRNTEFTEISSQDCNELMKLAFNFESVDKGLYF